MKFDSYAWTTLLNDVLPVTLCITLFALTFWVIRLLNPLKPPDEKPAARRTAPPEEDSS